MGMNVMYSYKLGCGMVEKRSAEFSHMTVVELVHLEDRCKAFALQHSNPFQLGKAAAIHNLIMQRAIPVMEEGIDNVQTASFL